MRPSAPHRKLPRSSALKDRRSLLVAAGRRCHAAFDDVRIGDQLRVFQARPDVEKRSRQHRLAGRLPHPIQFVGRITAIEPGRLQTPALMVVQPAAQGHRHAGAAARVQFSAPEEHPCVAQPQHARLVSRWQDIVGGHQRRNRIPIRPQQQVADL